MSSPLSAIPIDRRRRLAATLGLFAALFVAVGAVAATGPGTVLVRAFSGIATIAALVLALMAWGLAHGVKLDLADADLDRQIDAALAANSGSSCGCGCQHDMDAITISAATSGTISGADNVVASELTNDVHPAHCAHDGTGTACGHSCDTCLLGGLGRKPTPPEASPAASQPSR